MGCSLSTESVDSRSSSRANARRPGSPQSPLHLHFGAGAGPYRHGNRNLSERDRQIAIDSVIAQLLFRDQVNAIEIHSEQRAPPRVDDKANKGLTKKEIANVGFIVPITRVKKNFKSVAQCVPLPQPPSVSPSISERTSLSCATAGIAGSRPESVDSEISLISLTVVTTPHGQVGPRNLEADAEVSDRQTLHSSLNSNAMDMCAMCYETFDIEEDENVRLLHCGHFYHVDCIDRWLYRSRTCPTCCADVTEPPRHLETPHGGPTVTVNSLSRHSMSEGNPLDGRRRISNAFAQSPSISGSQRNPNAESGNDAEDWSGSVDFGFQAHPRGGVPAASALAAVVDATELEDY